MSLLLSPLAAIGATVLAALAAMGRVALFAFETVTHLFRPPFYGRELWIALVQIGWLSLPVVGLTALFTGGALALQIYSGGARFNAEEVVPSIVAIGMVRELGPVLGGLMVAARVASSIAAEIGTMKVTEQIDALTTGDFHFRYIKLVHYVCNGAQFFRCGQATPHARHHGIGTVFLNVGVSTFIDVTRLRIIFNFSRPGG